MAFAMETSAVWVTSVLPVELGVMAGSVGGDDGVLVAGLQLDGHPLPV